MYWSSSTPATEDSARFAPSAAPTSPPGDLVGRQRPLSVPAERDDGGFVTVRAGAVWWVLDSDGQVVTNEGDPSYGLGMRPEFGLLHTVPCSPQRSLKCCAT